MSRAQAPLRPLQTEGSKEIRHLLESFNRLQQRISDQNKALRENAEKLQLSARVFENSGESVLITDSEQRILSINRAFTEVTGYPPEEVLGQTPRLLSSGRHDQTFFRKMWQKLEQNGYWQGEIWDKRKSGEIYPEWLRISVVKDERGQVTHYIGVFSDISERKLAEARIEFLAYHDALTGLPNRLLATDHLELALAHANRLGNKTAVIFFDLDNFKTINDSFGHTTGDLLLQAVASRLQTCIRGTDTLSRQGGDEFLLILPDIQGADDITSVAEKILETLSPTFDIENNELSTSTSMGIAVYPDDGGDIETLLKRADTAMYHAKEAGRNTYRFYTEQMNIDAIEHHHIRIGLLRALERQELVLYYQPQVDLSSGAIVGAEALIRWQHPERGLLPPGAFIPTAEESGLIVEIGEWVIQEACRQAAAWRQAGLPELLVAVNVSAMQFKRGDLEATVQQALAATDLPPHCLELELTESILIHDTDKVLEMVQRLKAQGLMLSIDDFGTGYSSLSYLKRFNVDKLKIDRSFICDMETNPSDAVMVRAIIQMARSLNLKTIAEGVENEHLMSFLRLQYCDEVQGYHIAPPMPADQFAAFLSQHAQTLTDY
jgi:diguanylate cyclase (GGDEF)-like protein/PAS domain S-box-containing protein